MTDREQLIAGLRSLATFLAMNPEVKAPTYIPQMFCNLAAADVRPTARKLRTFKKVYNGTEFQMVKSFGPISVQWYTDREAVCKKIVVGTKEVPEMIISAKPEQHIPASEEQIIPAHTEEITEWVCSDAALMEEEEISA